MAIEPAPLRDALAAACGWLTDVATLRTASLGDVRNSFALRHADWTGALRGEYRASTRTWDQYAPVWHTGQAVKALVLAERVLGDARLLDAARLCAGFVMRERTADPADPDFGLLHAYEDRGHLVNVSAVLEAVDGLFLLADRTGEEAYRAAAAAAVAWCLRRAYLPGEGLFRDSYDPAARAFAPGPWADDDALRRPGRPLLEDAVLLKTHRLTGDPAFRTAFLETADRLLAEEEPAGTWQRFPPSGYPDGPIHPRTNYWWGLPLVEAYRETGDGKYLACAVRAARWYAEAQRTDGGIFRNTTRDFRTPTFGSCTSGIACAAILWQELTRTPGGGDWTEPADRALDFCRRMQLTDAADPALRGAVVEIVLPPDGTDRCPYYLRDLSAIFFAQAAALRLGA